MTMSMSYTDPTKPGSLLVPVGLVAVSLYIYADHVTQLHSLPAAQQYNGPSSAMQVMRMSIRAVEPRTMVMRTFGCTKMLVNCSTLWTVGTVARFTGRSDGTAVAIIAVFSQSTKVGRGSSCNLWVSGLGEGLATVRREFTFVRVTFCVCEGRSWSEIG